MFKKFKDKLAEEMKQSPARLQAGMQQLAQVVPSITNISTSELSTSNDNFSLTEGDDDTPKNTPDKYKLQAVDLTSYSSNSMGLSRTSSVNSLASIDTSGLFPIYENPGSTYHLQSDMDQSASEIDEHINPQFDQVSKEQIYAAYRKVQTKYHKYRGRYTDLANYYREMERAKSKLESLLVETQDKALRRIADLKEQCQLEQQAKAHLEEALRNDIEEKDHIIDTLNTKVKLLQVNSSSIIALHNQENLIDITNNTDQIENNSSELLDNIPINDQSNIPETLNSVQSQLTEENEQLKNKLEKLESLIVKYKELLKRSKEKISEITQDKTILESDMEKISKNNSEQMHLMTENLNEAKAEIIILKEKINEMKRVEEESAISLAENKLSIHRELEIKEKQIKQLKLELDDAMQSKEATQMELNNKDSEMNETAKNVRESMEQEFSDLQEKYLQQNESLKSLNDMIETYVVEIDETRQKILAQNSEINQLKEELIDNNEKFRLEIENKSSDIFRLENELTDCRSTIDQLSDKLTNNSNINDKLIKEKNNLIKYIVDCLTNIQSLRHNYDQLKLELTDGEINQKQELSQISKLIQKTLCNYQSHLIDVTDVSTNEVKKLYESQLEEKNTEIVNIKAKLSDVEEKYRGLSMDLENFNDKISDTKKKHDRALERIEEVVEQRDLLDKQLRDVELKYANHLDIMQTMEKEIEIVRKKCVGYEESIEQYNNEKYILIQNAEKATFFEEECHKLNTEINDKTMKLNNEISRISSENEIYKHNLAENAIQLQSLTDKNKILNEQYENLKSEVEHNAIQLEGESANLQKLIADNSKLSGVKSALSIQVQNLTDMVQAKNDYMEKLKLAKMELIQKLQDNEFKIMNLLTEKSELIKQNSELNLRQNESDILQEKLASLSDKNNNLETELERQREINNNLNSQVQENNNLMTIIEEFKNYKEKSEMEKKQMKNIENELLQANQELQDGKNLLEERVEELQELSRVHSKEIADLKKEIERKIIEIEESQKNISNESQFEDNRLQHVIEELQSQLNEKDSLFISSQAVQSQIENENEKMKNEMEKLREELATLEAEQTMRMQQLVKEFQARLHDKDTELQAALDQKFDWQKNYESELVQQYREQLKDFQLELTAKSEEIEGLKIDKNSDSNKEVEKLIETIATIKMEHANELKDADVKWRETIKQKCDQLEAKHNSIVNDLTNEWKKNKFTDENLVQNPEELENMSAMAMAAVQSNTGSFHSLQQTLINQRRELVELRKLVKLRQETLDDSTEIEYLRNILYEYMMGKETLVLARVIAAVVKFDQDQTTKILKKEEDKLTLVRMGSLGLT